MVKRGEPAGIEDRWHRPARKNEQVSYPADAGPGDAVWCTDSKHGSSGTLVCTGRHGVGHRWQARWVGDGQERSGYAFSCGCRGHDLTGGYVCHGAGVTTLRAAIKSHDAVWPHRVLTLRERLLAAKAAKAGTAWPGPPPWSSSPRPTRSPGSGITPPPWPRTSS